jgi:hypothetical protein
MKAAGGIGCDARRLSTGRSIRAWRTLCGRQMTRNAGRRDVISRPRAASGLAMQKDLGGRHGCGSVNVPTRPDVDRHRHPAAAGLTTIRVAIIIALMAAAPADAPVIPLAAKRG